MSSTTKKTKLVTRSSSPEIPTLPEQSATKFNKKDFIAKMTAEFEANCLTVDNNENQ